MKIVSISLSEQSVKSLAKLAKQQRVSKSQIVREALDNYEFKKEWAQIREWGRKTALEFNITSYDDVERIAGRHA